MTDDPEPFLITIDGALDAEAARAVVQRIRGIGRERHVILDFAFGAERALVPLSLIADALARRGIPVARAAHPVTRRLRWELR